MFVVYIIDTGYKYYTGMTSERRLPERIQEHLDRRKSGYLTKWHRNRPRKPVYIEILGHDCYECALIREEKVKNLTPEKKKELIKYERNHLIKINIKFAKLKKIILK